ncbi:TLDc domain-containing protein [Entamoeba marina]
MNTSGGSSKLIEFMKNPQSMAEYFEQMKIKQTKEFDLCREKNFELSTILNCDFEETKLAMYQNEYDELIRKVHLKDYDIKLLKLATHKEKNFQNTLFDCNSDDFEKVIQKEQLIVDMMKMYLNKIKFVMEIYHDEIFQKWDGAKTHDYSCDFIESVMEFKEKMGYEKKLKLDEMMLKYCFNPNELQQINYLHSPQEQIRRWLNWNNCCVAFDSSIHSNDDVKIRELKSRNKEHLFFVLYDDCGNVFGAYLNPSLVDGGWIMDPHCFVCSFRRNGINNYKTYSLDTNYKIEPTEMNWLHILGYILTNYWHGFEDVMDKIWYCNPSCINYKGETNALVDDSYTNEYKITKIIVLSNVECTKTPSINHLLSLFNPSYFGQTKIYVKTITGSTHTFGITLDEPVWMLKERIGWDIDIPPDQQRLIFAGKQMEEEKNNFRL